MALTYILFSRAANRFYTGSSRDDDLSKRLSAHNRGGVKSTKSGKPWVVVMTEQFTNYTDARKRELFLKSGIGRKWIKENFGYLKTQ